MPDVSIVIPTLNEARCLSRTLRHLSLLNPRAREILIVDGGSTDETIAIAHDMIETLAPTPIKVVTMPTCGRSLQMNRGAEVATGEILCFLHADTLVPDDLVAVVEKTLAQPDVACGGFISLMTGPHITRWGIYSTTTSKPITPPCCFVLTSF